VEKTGCVRARQAVDLHLSRKAHLRADTCRHHLQKCQSHLVDLSTDLVCVPCWGNAAWSRRHGRDPKRVTASRANGRPSIRSARLHWESHVFKRVRQGALALAVLAPAGSTVTARGTTVLLVAELLAVLVIISVVWAAIWSSDRSGARTHWRSWTASCDEGALICPERRVRGYCPLPRGGSAGHGRTPGARLAGAAARNAVALIKYG
jgi:hypothetical protein